MKASEWARERKQWFKDHPQDYYVCHYSNLSLMPSETTLDHTNNRKHEGTLVPCSFMDNARKGSMSHDRYVAKYYPDHECDLGDGGTAPPKYN